jgi:hypothetical protein
VLYEVSDEDRIEADAVIAEPETLKYHFGSDFLELSTIGTQLSFSVGAEPVKNFRMIERHYFKNRLIKSFDFGFPFCIPNSQNTWEHIYELPKFSPQEKQDIISHPWETVSDSYFFVENELIMH